MSAFIDNAGKIGAEAFKEILLPQCGAARPEVVLGPRFGVDTALINLGNNMGLAVASDPLSLIPALGLQESAWLSVHLLANDMATTGFAPQFAQFVLNLPTSLSAAAFQEYWGHIHRFCSDIGVAITGGHTGQIEGQNSTIAGGGTMFLTAPLDQMLASSGARPGDIIVVTKEAALTASSILGLSFPETVKNKLGQEVYQIACENFYRTSSLPDALAATEVLKPHLDLTAMHDVTEGGLLGAITEMAAASGCGFWVEDEKLPIDEAPYQITSLFNIDYRYSVGAGAMIMAVQKEKLPVLIQHLATKNIQATAVGEFTTAAEGCKILQNEQMQELNFNGKDPYWEAFFNAYKAGLK